MPDLGPAGTRSVEQVLGGRGDVTLQSMVLALQGTCTEPGMFYNLAGPVWFSETSGAVFLGPAGSLRTDTFANMLDIGNWHRACLLNGLYLAVKGSGQVEIAVYRSMTGHSLERLARESCELSATAETVLDLSSYVLLADQGGIWFEVRNISQDDIASVTSARYLTAGAAGDTMRLALCMARSAETAAPDEMAHGLLDAWCAGRGQAAQAKLVRFEAGLAPLAQLQAVKAQGFTHAVLMAPSTVIAPEVLARTQSFLALARSPSVALGAATLDPAERYLVASGGVTEDRDGKVTTKYQGCDLRDVAQVVRMACELAEIDDGSLMFQPEFLALALQDLPTAATLAAATLPAVSDFDAALRQSGLVLQHPVGFVVNRDASARNAAKDLVALQHVIYPEAGLCTEAHMYFHASGPTSHGPTSHGPTSDNPTSPGPASYSPASYNPTTRSLRIENGAVVHFDSYFNALNIGKWHATCLPKGLYLGLNGGGRVEVKVFHAVPDRSWELLYGAAHTLSTAGELLIDLSHYAMTSVNGMIYFELHAIGQGVELTEARFAVPGKINPDVKLCLSITTFKREAEVENTARRMAAYFKTCDFADQMHLNIVDNGNSANIIDDPRITRIPNANLGGAGGFTRGLIEGDKAGFSHVLFMDDDASIPMEALHRAYAFLTLSKDPKAAVAGAMISNSDKWRMWENGAVFDRNCRPQFNGVDLRDWRQVMEMEFASASYRSSKMYGGWWFFAFPVKAVTHYPFPFFVRGDDINFSLANDFHITTLNGVVSFAEDFSDKESPLTLYLDLRNHFVQHLTLEKMEIGPLNIARIGIGFFARNAVKFQYETIDALLMAWNDVLKGPEFFAQNADAAAQRAAVKALYKVESWKPVGDFNLTEKRRYKVKNGRGRAYFRWTLNGHLLPFYKLWGSRVVLQPRDRNNYAPIWGAARTTYLNSTREKAYTVTHSKTRFFAQSFRLLWLTLRLYFGYKPLLAKYRKGYGEITVPGFWQKALKLTKPAEAPAVTVAEKG